jgi:hypothetical protein
MPPQKTEQWNVGMLERWEKTKTEDSTFRMLSVR